MMMRKLRVAIAGFVVMMAVAMPAVALAFDPFDSLCTQSNAAGSALCSDKGQGTENPLTGPNGLFRGIAGVIALISGIIAVIIILTAGLGYITSGGDPGKTKAAKEAIIAALAGLVIIVLADSIISFVLSRVIS